jgi:hypothetical protein
MFALVLLTLATQINLNQLKQPRGFEFKPDPFIAKLIAPDVNDSPLLKLQKERARARALFVFKVDEGMPISSWSTRYITECAEERLVLWENLEEVAQTPADKLKCAEMRLEAAKGFEKYSSTRVEVGSDHSLTLNFAKAARIDAEINLLKLKETLKDKK